MSDRSVPQRLLDLAGQAAAPDFTNAGLRDRFGDPLRAEILQGQVWRVRWDDVTVLILVMSVDGRAVDGVPLVVDPLAEDDDCLVIDGELTAFGVPVVVWAGLRGVVPTRVLDRVVDEWPAIVEAVMSWRPLATDRAPLATGVRPGRSIGDSSAALLRAEIQDDLDQLREAPGLPVEDPGHPTPTLAELLGKVDLAALCEALSLRQPEVMKLLRGTIEPTAENVDVLAAVTGRTAAEIRETAGRLPVDLVESAEHPRWRHAWQAMARRMSISEAEARSIGARSAFGLAARETGSGPSRGWEQRLAHAVTERDGLT